MSAEPDSGLAIAVTGPTGDIGRALIRALERSPKVASVVGMARSPFDPAAEGWRKTSYRQGNVLDRASVDALVKGADVVIHLAFLILGGIEETRRVNLEGTRNVFEATVAAGAKRLVYTSSVAAYGFHDDNPLPLTEDVPARGSDDFYYSAQKAELERVLAETVAGTATDAYVFRPCIVAGEGARTFIEEMPYLQVADRVPGPVKRLLDELPLLRPVLPNPGVPLQLVHHDDVAAALRAAALGRGEPGVYNLAGEGKVEISDVADELGWYSLPLPEIAIGAAAEAVARVPFMPAQASWVNVMRTPVLMDCSKARSKLGWRPKHDAFETLRETVRAVREELPAR